MPVKHPLKMPEYEADGSDSSVFVYNRQKRTLEEEVICGRRLAHLCYESYLGRSLADLFLPRRSVSKLFGLFQSSPISRKRINSFIDQHMIDMTEVDIPPGGFRSFNKFFTRRLKPDARPVCADPAILISPADSRLLVYPVEKNTVYPVKGVHFNLEELTGTSALTEPYYGGICMVFRLAPTDYHRFCYIDRGSHGPVIPIQGDLHSVSPVALRQNLKVFQKNYREHCILLTENFGEAIQIEVGALLVGKIHQHLRRGGQFCRGDEKGYFEFGGSTILLILKTSVVTVDEDIAEYSKKGIETLVRYGSPIGKRLH